MSDPVTYLGKVLPELSIIRDDKLREGVVEVFRRAMEMARIDDLSSLPFTVTYETDIPFVDHLRAVTNMALRMAEELKRFGINPDTDTLVAGALLHDIGKVMEFNEGDGVEPYVKGAGPYCGKLLKHTFTGAALAQEVGLAPSILHCIIYHSYEGGGRRRSMESVIVHHCDFIHFETVKAIRQGKGGGGQSP